MLLTVIEKMEEFDTTVYGIYTEYVDKANEKSNDLIKWLYLVASHSPSISSVFAAPVNNRGIKKLFEGMIENSISVETPVPSNVIPTHSSSPMDFSNH